MSEKKQLDKRPIRDLLQEKDAFLTTSEKAYEYFLRHSKALVVTVAAVAICIIALAVYTRYQKSVEAESALAYEKALNLTTGQSEDITAGLEALEKVRTDYAGRRGARLAAFTLVNLYATRDMTDKALPLAENLLQTLKPSEISLKPLLLNNLGGLYESGGDFQRAATSYQAILSSGHLEPALRMETLMALGRVKAAAGQKDQAVEFYQTLIKEFPQSFRAYMANAKIAELKGEVALFPLPASEPPVLTSEAKAEAEKGQAAESPAAEAIDAAESGEAPTAASTDESAETAPGQSDSSENAPTDE